MQTQRIEPRQEIRQEQRTKTFVFDAKPEARTSRLESHQETRSDSSGPLKKFRSGALSVAIWENETLGDDGQPRSFKTVSFERSYKDKNGEWKSSNSLRVNDLPKAALILSKAYEYLVLTGADDAEEY